MENKIENMDDKLEEQNIEIPEVEVETGDVALDAEELVEISEDIRIETNKEKKAREKKEAKAEKEAKKQKRIERQNTKAAKFIRRSAIWILAILIIFLAGFATSHIIISRPTMAELEQSIADLTTAEAKIISLESEVEDLSSLEAVNESLQTEIEDVNTHITILSARVSVTDALLALQDGDLAEVSLELDKVEATLKTLKTMLNADQQAVVTSMEQRLDLVMGELDEDTTAAAMDLEVLSAKLTSLENTLFANP